MLLIVLCFGAVFYLYFFIRLFFGCGKRFVVGLALIRTWAQLFFFRTIFFFVEKCIQSGFISVDASCIYSLIGLYCIGWGNFFLLDFAVVNFYLLCFCARFNFGKCFF